MIETSKLRAVADAIDGHGRPEDVALVRRAADELDEMDRQVDELLAERDAAEDAADDLASLILGEPVDWSDHPAKWAEASEKMQ